MIFSEPRTVHPGMSLPGSSHEQLAALLQVDPWKLRLIAVFGEKMFKRIEEVVMREQGAEQ